MGSKKRFRSSTPVSCSTANKLGRIDSDLPTTKVEQIEKPLVVEQQKKPRITFVLDKASLQTGFVGKTVKLLNADEHAQSLLKQNKALHDYRPDIAHRALLAIFDSPLSKAGLVHAIYVRTEKGVLFEVKTHVRIPRTIKRFNGLMLELLQKSSIKAKDTEEKLLSVLQQPVTRHLPENSRIIGLSYSSEKLVNLKEYVAKMNDDVNLVFVVGAMTQGTIDKNYLDDFISASSYPMSASRCVGVICQALEKKWNIF
ncbi:rRNA small subunit pseudouridine methyltransferase Nep1 [Ranunculus cassubicifolius]